MRLLVGLGNPGTPYAHNRHNIGYMAADEIVRRHGFGPWRSKFQGVLSEGTLSGQKLLVLKPETFMNSSGEAVAAAARFHKIDPADIIVLHDDLDLIPGKVRVKRGGGSGGHNGLKSIDAHLGPDYWRIRLGIGHPGDKSLVTAYVLGNFFKAEDEWLKRLLSSIADELPMLLDGQDNAFMTKLAQLAPPPKPKDEITSGES